MRDIAIGLSTAVAIMLIAITSFVCGAASAWADDEWPQFRGPDGQGHAVSANLPTRWSESENVTWKVAIPGEGHSSPVISGNQIWLTTAIARPLTDAEEKERLAKLKDSNGLKLAGALSLQAIQINRETGRIERQITLFEVNEPEPKHSMNSYASPTPVMAGQHVYFHFGTYGTACVDRESGAIVWENREFHIDHQNGPGSSPVLWDDKLIIHFDGTDHQFIAAFDRMTGKVLWKTERSGEMDPTPELQKAYGTPVIADVNGIPMVISPAANWVYGYDARDGREVWKAHYGQLGFSTVPRPVLLGNTAFIATSYMQSRLLAVRIDGEGDVTASHVTWMSDKQIPKKPSMIVSGEHLYFVSDAGILRCLNAATGDEVWFERIDGEYSASPISSGNRLYFFGQNGQTTVIDDSEAYTEIARNVLDGEFMASPAVAGDSLFLRTSTHLYRIDQTN